MNQISLGEKRFTCQQSGHCCCDPNIIVTLTFRDLFRLFRVLDNDFRILQQRISFYTLEESDLPILQKQMVLKPIQASEGKVIPGLRKLEEICVFYERPNCKIYPERPLSCQSYPIAFIKKGEYIICTWVKNSRETCPGIGKGPPVSLLYIEQLGKRFFKEIEEHNHVVGELNKEASQGHPLTAREALWILVSYGESKQNEK